MSKHACINLSSSLFLFPQKEKRKAKTGMVIKTANSNKPKNSYTYIYFFLILKSGASSTLEEFETLDLFFILWRRVRDWSEEKGKEGARKEKALATSRHLLYFILY
jgi:protoporphyrinogen oxidase